MEEFRAELSADPQSAPAALAMGEIDRHEGHLDEAAVDYRLASRLDPELTEARVGLAQTFLAQHQVAASQAELSALLATHPENAQAHYTMMLTYRAQGNLPEAAREMEAFKRLQQGGAEQFRDKLNALLGGAPSELKVQKSASPTTPGTESGP